MKTDRPLSRRQICVGMAMAVPASLVLTTSLRALADEAKTPPASTDLKLVPDSDPTAKALQYVHDGSKAKREKRGAV